MKRIILIGLGYIGRALDILVPRIVTDDVALWHGPRGYEVACRLCDVRPHESFHAVGRVRAFNVLGRAYRGRLIGSPQPWRATHNPHRARRR